MRKRIKRELRMRQPELITIMPGWERGDQLILQKWKPPDSPEPSLA
jgi:hypothetical protein